MSSLAALLAWSIVAPSSAVGAAVPTFDCGGADGALRIHIGAAVLTADADRVRIADAPQVVARVPKTPVVASASPDVLELAVPQPSGALATLVLGAPWRVRAPDGLEKALATPRGFKTSQPPRVLAMTNGVVFLATTDRVASVDTVSATSHSSQWLGAGAPVVIGVGEQHLRIVSGRKLFDCDDEASCFEVGESALEVKSSIPGEGFVVLHGTYSREGIFGVEEADLAAPRALAVGRVLAGCDLGASQSLWVVEPKDASLLVVRVSGASVEATTSELLGELVARAVARATERPDAAVQVLVDWLIEQDARGLEPVLMALARAPEASLRAFAAERLARFGSVAAYARLFVLGHDPEATVRIAAVESASAWCQASRWVGCVEALAPFTDDTDPEVAWIARDALLPIDPGLALAGAARSYKLAALSTLVSSAQRGSAWAAVAFELLLSDADDVVRLAAGTVAAGANP